MIRCNKLREHPAVRREIDKWLAANEEGIKVLWKEWQVKAAVQVKEAYNSLRKYEISLFEGTKSHFRCKEQNTEPPRRIRTTWAFRTAMIEFLGFLIVWGQVIKYGGGWLHISSITIALPIIYA
jgi:uncharacterized protein YndB with AHSA1/START domain